MLCRGVNNLALVTVLDQGCGHEEYMEGRMKEEGGRLYKRSG